MEADLQSTEGSATNDDPLDAAPTSCPEPQSAPEAIVAIGASAGGLEAIEQFFGEVEAPSRLAFVIVQHLSPDLKSLMRELLSRRTTLALPPVVDGMRPAANAIYLIPPGKRMTIEGGVLLLADRDARDFAYHPIDEFFLSLAADQGAAAIGVVLSGSGSDGSRGARAILRAGGRVLVQAPATAKFSSMPKAALEAGCTNDVMPPEAMPRALLEVEARPRPEHGKLADNGLPTLLVDTLDATFGIDFSSYRAGTVQRRVRRRMMLRGFEQIQDYAELVADDGDEQEALYQDLLIGGTAFFRDAEAFEALERFVMPALAAELDAGREVRIWVPAVATGEEAYSIAILLLAQCREQAGEPPLRIFATDVHRRSLAVAAAGHYSEEAVRNLRPEWLERYFSRRGSGYQAIPALRRCIVFSPHDLLKDPPFTRLQLVSCRNLLIYLKKAAQEEVLQNFSAALQADGHLLLGSSESPGTLDADFEAVAGALSLYRRRPGSTSLARPALVPSVLAAGGQAGGRNPPVPSGGAARPERRDQRLTMAHELLLDRYVPPSLLVDAAGLVVHCFGDAGAYLRQPRGRPSLALLDMIVEPLRGPLGSAMSRVRRTGHPITLRHVAAGDDHVLQRLVVEMLPAPGDGRRCLLVSFDDRQGPVETGESEPAIEPDARAAERIRELERDLGFAEESLRATVEELGSANQELLAANEELRAANRELQSAMNELHSVNDELQAVGTEHQRRIAALVQSAQDTESLLASAELAAVFVDADLRVRRFTPALGRFFNLIAQDIGRPLAHLTHGFGDADIVGRLRDVTATGDILSADLLAADGAVVRLRAVPHRGSGEQVTGVTVTFVDVTDSLRQAEALARARIGVAVLLEALPQPAALANGTGRLTAANVPMEEVAAAAGLMPDLVGRELGWLLGPFLDATALEELSRRLATGADWRHRMVTEGGGALSVELRSSDGPTVVLVLLEPPPGSAVAPPATDC
jgi:two-component system CheB/CheR fusion protein